MAEGDGDGFRFNKIEFNFHRALLHFIPFLFLSKCLDQFLVAAFAQHPPPLRWTFQRLLLCSGLPRLSPEQRFPVAAGDVVWLLHARS